jgi:hypothetical protein
LYFVALEFPFIDLLVHLLLFLLEVRSLRLCLFQVEHQVIDFFVHSVLHLLDASRFGFRGSKCFFHLLQSTVQSLLRVFQLLDLCRVLGVSFASGSLGDGLLHLLLKLSSRCLFVFELLC